MISYLDVTGLQRYHERLAETIPIVDGSLDDTSENAVQNKVVTAELDEIKATLQEIQATLEKLTG